jgi:hypothetical protein
VSAPSIIALSWLVILAVAVHLGVSTPDGFGWAVFFATLWALGFLYFRACRHFPVFGWLALGFVAGLFGGSRYSHTTTVVERDYVDSGDCSDRDDAECC